MKRALLLLAAVGLTGCHKMETADGASHHGGRYLGIGTYPAGELWQHLACLIHEPAAHWCFGFGGSVAA